MKVQLCIWGEPGTQEVFHIRLSRFMIYKIRKGLGKYQRIKQDNSVIRFDLWVQ